MRSAPRIIAVRRPLRPVERDQRPLRSSARISRSTTAAAHLFVAAWCLTLCCWSGCAERNCCCCIPRNDARPAGNLALGSTRDLSLNSELVRERQLAPEAIIGYRLESISGATTVYYDDQSFHDRFGGGLYHTGISYSEETWLR